MTQQPPPLLTVCSRSCPGWRSVSLDKQALVPAAHKLCDASENAGKAMSRSLCRSTPTKGEATNWVGGGGSTMEHTSDWLTAAAAQWARWVTAMFGSGDDASGEAASSPSAEAATTARCWHRHTALLRTLVLVRGFFYIIIT